jgi:hypothetical protein
MVRFLIFLVGMLTTNRPGGMRTVPLRRDDSFGRADLPEPDEEGADDGDTWYLPPQSPLPQSLPSQRPYREAGRAPVRLDRGHVRTSPRSIRRKLTWAAVVVLAGLLLRKVIAWVALVALSATLHLFGFNVRLPHIKLAWPWQAISAGTTTDTNIGPWVLQKIEGISRPALGTENFNFTFTHKVSKSIGIWPCWYSSTFAAVGHASATVDLNPGSAWWTPASGHYRLQVLSRPATGTPGRVSVSLVLPEPQLPQSVHDVTVDNTLSHPIDVQHSWTYPGFGCGALIRPQFSVSVLYGQAQNLAFAQVTQNPQITGPLISTAEAQAVQMVRNNFIQPTVNALGYTLVGFTIHWSGAR